MRCSRMPISARNQIKGTVASITKGEAIANPLAAATLAEVCDPGMASFSGVDASVPLGANP